MNLIRRRVRENLSGRAAGTAAKRQRVGRSKDRERSWRHRQHLPLKVLRMARRGDDQRRHIQVLSQAGEGHGQRASGWHGRAGDDRFARTKGRIEQQLQIGGGDVERNERPNGRRPQQRIIHRQRECAHPNNATTIRVRGGDRSILAA